DFGPPYRRPQDALLKVSWALGRGWTRSSRRRPAPGERDVMAKSTAANTPTINRRYARFRLRVRRSRIHRWGVCAGEAIPSGRKVLEYTGEKINRSEKKRREDCKYLFELDSYWTLDGGVGGSGAEFVNHSCNPNLV